MEAEFINQQYILASNKLGYLINGNLRFSKCEQSACAEALDKYFNKGASLRRSATSANQKFNLKCSYKIEQILYMCISDRYSKQRGRMTKNKIKRKANLMM